MTGEIAAFVGAQPPPLLGPTASAPARATRVQLRLLGGFELWHGGELAPIPDGPRRLVAMLALRGANGRSRLAGSLWPDVAQARAMASLRTAIWRVNQAVPSLILSSAGNLVLDRATDVDVDRLVAVSRTLLTAAATPTQFETLGAEGGGDLLPDWDEDWLDGDRERLRQLRLHVLEAHAERLLEAGAFGLALERALAALCCDPLRESAHRAVIRIHIAEGNFAEARHAYSRCRHILARELAVSPSGQTVSLVRDLRTDAPHDASPGHREGVADTRGALASGRPS